MQPGNLTTRAKRNIIRMAIFACNLVLVPYFLKQEMVNQLRYALVYLKSQKGTHQYSRHITVQTWCCKEVCPWEASLKKAWAACSMMAMDGRHPTCLQARPITSAFAFRSPGSCVKKTNHTRTHKHTKQTKPVNLLNRWPRVTLDFFVEFLVGGTTMQCFPAMELTCGSFAQAVANRAACS